MKYIKNTKFTHLFSFLGLFILSMTSLVGCDKGNIEPKPIEPNEYSITYAGLDDATNPNTITSYTADSGLIPLLDPIKDGISVASYFDWREERAEYDEEYTPKPKLLDGFVLDNTKQIIGLYSVFAVGQEDTVGYHILETIFDLPFTNEPAKKLHVDNRL